MLFPSLSVFKTQVATATVGFTEWALYQLGGDGDGDCYIIVMVMVMLIVMVIVLVLVMVILWWWWRLFYVDCDGDIDGDIDGDGETVGYVTKI